MSNYFIPLLSAAIGALLGILSSFLSSSLRQRQDITLRLMDQYFEVRREIVTAVCELSDLNLREPLDLQCRNDHADAVSKLFYKHYDFLPKPVLESLILLQVCLTRSDGKVYKFADDVVMLMEEADTVRFIESCALFKNSRYIAAIALKSNDITIRTNQATVLHARNVLNCLNEYASVRELVKMIGQLKKDRVIMWR